jgi:hypothetical protein
MKVTSAAEPDVVAGKFNLILKFGIATAAHPNRISY